jgi:hypothetical protein
MIDINESETVLLVGIQLLRGYDLRIQAVDLIHRPIRYNWAVAKSILAD